MDINRTERLIENKNRINSIIERTKKESLKVMHGKIFEYKKYFQLLQARLDGNIYPHEEAFVNCMRFNIEKSLDEFLKLISFENLTSQRAQGKLGSSAGIIDKRYYEVAVLCHYDRFKELADIFRNNKKKELYPGNSQLLSVDNINSISSRYVLTIEYWRSSIELN